MRSRWAAAALGLLLAAWPASAGGHFPDLVRNATTAELRAALAAGTERLDRPDPLTGLTALTTAALHGRAGMVAEMLAHGADTEAAGPQGMSALSALARSCRADPLIVAALLEAGADPDARSGAGLVPAMAALQVLRPDIANRIIEAGADVNAVNRHGDGILNFAIYFRQPGTIRLLLERGVDPAQLGVLFTTDRYYQLGFGPGTIEARRLQCDTSAQ